MAPSPPPPPPPQLHSVVIISLPPPDNPSKGKTITAYTYSEDDSIPVQSQPPPSRLSGPAASSRRRVLRRLPKRAVVAFLGAALLFLALWAGMASEAPLQLLREPAEDGRRKEANSFLLPLYHKSRIGTRPMAMEAEIKTVKRIGNVVEMQSGNRSKLALSTGVLPLKGNIFPDGQYYTSVSIGNPPRPYFLDVDTGSDLTWIQCDAPCTSCAKGPHPLYKPSKANIVPPKDSLCLEVQSSQNREHCGSCQQCDYEVEYADRSSSMGVLARDDMKLVANDNMMESKFVFGCAYDQQGHLLTAKTDGILGLSSARASLPSQLANRGSINNVVGHCINNEENVDGYMFLGDDFVPRWGMNWVPTLGGLTNYYNSEVFKVSYGDQQISIRGQRRNVGEVVFDTGSTYTYLTYEAYTNLITSLKSVRDVLVLTDSDPTLPVCWRADFPVRSVKDVEHLFEPLTLHFGKRWWVMPTKFIIPPEGYLTVNNKGNICLGVLDGSEVLDGSIIILGDISLRGKLVVYDNVQQRIGWAESDCAKPQKPNGFPFFL